jgi:glycosyltransferase involved in cell wall biosynthesis
MSKRIAIIYDVPGWAQHRFATSLQKYAPEGVEVTLFSDSQWRDPSESFDVAFLLPLYHASCIFNAPRVVGMLAADGWMYNEVDTRDWRTKSVTRLRRKEYCLEYLTQLDGVLVRNERLAEFVRSNSKTEVTRIPVGIDLGIFTPRPERKDGPFRVGWCGNVAGANNSKGYGEVLVPLMGLTSDEVEWDVITTDYRNARPWSEMVRWYHTLDAFVCTSCSDGTPNPPFEAAACGVPILSTSVGAVTDWKKANALQVVVPCYNDRGTAGKTVKVLREKLLKLKNDPAAAFQLGSTLRQSIQEEYDYVDIAPRVTEFLLGDGTHEDNYARTARRQAERERRKDLRDEGLNVVVDGNRPGLGKTPPPQGGAARPRARHI